MFQTTKIAFIQSGSDRESTNFSTLAGKRWAITYVSGQINLPGGQKPLEFRLGVGGTGGGAAVDFAPVFMGTDLNGEDSFAIAQDTLIFSDSSDIQFFWTRNALAGEGFGQVSLSGYLIDCSVEACT